jgi:CheY-like chemotaxis protein/CRP-like cAMP-binding protein
MPPETSKLLVQVLRKIPIFVGLSPSQVKRILAHCQHESYRPGSLLCRGDTPSDEMYILLSGELIVSTVEGVRVATIIPVTIVGEMGVITGQPRSATVEVCKQSNIFTIQKSQFDLMLREDRDMRSVVYRNIIDVLAGKLTKDNIRIRDHQIERDRLNGHVSILERKISGLQERFGLALDLAESHSGVARDVLELQINEQVVDLTPSLLVVDDEADFRRLVREALPAFTVAEAEDGKQALDVVHEEKMDIVLTDIRMPNMDGFALLSNLRSGFPSLPVLAVSGFMDAGQVEEHGFDGFIDKPVSLHDLQRLVEQTVNRGRTPHA